MDQALLLRSWCEGGEDEGGRCDEARVVVPLSLISNLVEKAHSPQYFSWMRMGGSYNDMKMLMVFVFWGIDLAQITGPPSRRRDTSLTLTRRMDLSSFCVAIIAIGFPPLLSAYYLDLQYST